MVYDGEGTQLVEATNFVTNVAEPKRKIEWHGQVGQDEAVATLFGWKREGYFVDLAANDPVELSNTYTLEWSFGWRGLCVEANPTYLDALTGKRSCDVVQAIVAATDGPVRFRRNGVFGGIVANDTDNLDDRRLYVLDRSVPLERILDAVHAPHLIDYLSLDVEGAESMVLVNFPFGRPYTILLISVERPKPDLQAYLRSYGYVLVYRNSQFGDSIYAHPALPNKDFAIANARRLHPEDTLLTEWPALGSHPYQHHLRQQHPR